MNDYQTDLAFEGVIFYHENQNWYGDLQRLYAKQMLVHLNLNFFFANLVGLKLP